MEQPSTQHSLYQYFTRTDKRSLKRSSRREGEIVASATSNPSNNGFSQTALTQRGILILFNFGVTSPRCGFYTASEKSLEIDTKSMISVGRNTDAESAQKEIEMKKLAVVVMLGVGAALAWAFWNNSGNALVAAPSVGANSSTATVESGNVTVEVAEYLKWKMFSEQKVNLPITGPTAASITVKGFLMRTYIENVQDEENSRWAEEIVWKNKVFLRTTVGRGAVEYNGPRTYQLLVNGKWLTGLPGVLPKLYLLDYVALFEKDEVTGVRVTLELADGTTAEAIVQ